MIPKFRAWDKDKKWMVYDVQNAYDGLWSERNSDEINDYYSYVSTFRSFTDGEDFNFMQYTGLEDANGLEIYEGDIMLDYKKVTRNKKTTVVEDYWEVYYKKEYGQFLLRSANKVRHLSFAAELEISGNIYENPELLEGQIK